MATILLQAAGGFVGGLIGGPFGAVAGRALGALGGYALDSTLFGKSRSAEGPRLAAGRITGADEGAGVARLYGTARIAGQIIWTTRFEEERSSERQGGKGGGTKVTSYSYFGNVAIGLCEGPIAGIRRVWADGEELDLTEVTYRLHRGTEDQLPDPLIEAKQGIGNAPAYRGLAYIVFERLPLDAWGNRVPQIACEVLRPVGELEQSLRAVTIIPGATEHGLDPEPVRETVAEGEDRVVNRNVLYAASDFEASIDELQGLCPKLERAALVVAWFGTDLRAGRCGIRPGVEIAERNESEPWRAGGVERAGAHLVSQVDGGPAYGGTPSDAGVVRAIADLRARGLKVTYYPFLLMDVPPDNALADPYGGARQPAFPWRGRLTLDVAPGLAGSSDGTAAAEAEIATFVGTTAAGDFAIAGSEVSYHGPAEWSYRRMVLQQAHLARAAGGVDAFVIGSELRGLTRIRGVDGSFPFVAALMALAVDVKAILPGAIVTYAADWSEYFGYQPADGSGNVFYNLDPLWVHPAIDVVGIDNYLPLADWRPDDWADGGPDGARSPCDREALTAGIAGGEDFDWYYASEADRRARLRTPIVDGAAGKPWVYRAKDIASWWSNPHFDRRGGSELPAASPWVPKSKPIWFTELGCPAVDKGANQPNVFVDPKSAESATPYFSGGGRDDLVQRRFLEAQLAFWDPASAGFQEGNNPASTLYPGRMVDASAIHVWTWDARPYPAFPSRTDLWRDGENWSLGHWLNGRLGKAPLDGLIRQLLTDHGFSDFTVAAADAEIGGYLVDGPGTARAELEDLIGLCGIVANAGRGRLVFRSLRSASRPQALEAFVDEDTSPFVEFRRMQASELPEEIVVGYLDPARSYQPAAAEAMLSASANPRQETIQLPVILDDAGARGLAAARLSDRLAARETASFGLSPADVAIEPGDVVTLDGAPGRWIVTRVETGLARKLEARRIASAGGEAGAEPAGTASAIRAPVVASKPLVRFLDLPSQDSDRPGESARIAIHARPWLPYSVDVAPGGAAFETRLLQARPATVGRLVAPLAPGPEGLIDRANTIEVELSRGALFSIARQELLTGANLCAVECLDGGWEVLQFETAEETAPMRFRLASLLRAQGGTEDAMIMGAAAGASFVLLDGAVAPIGLKPSEIGQQLTWRVSPSGRALDPATSFSSEVNLGLRGQRPLSPVHLRGSFEVDGALGLTWVRRTRTGGDSWDGLDVPLGEEIERYAFTATDEAGRVYAGESDLPEANIGAAAQLEAFGGLPATLVVEVCQLSLGWGAGIARTARFSRAS